MADKVRQISKPERVRIATMASTVPLDEREQDWIARGSPIVPPKIVCRVCGAAAIQGTDLVRVDRDAATGRGIFECRAGHA